MGGRPREALRKLRWCAWLASRRTVLMPANRELEKAGALCAAEIDRLVRLKAEGGEFV